MGFHRQIFIYNPACNYFQHIHDLLNLPDILNDKLPIDLSDVILANTSVIDTARHWSVLLFKEALCIRRLKPRLNHGLKASKDLVLFR